MQPKSVLPMEHPAASIFIDESGTAAQSHVMVVGALKFRSGHGPLVTQLDQFRNRSGWRSEAHFVDVDRKNSHIYREAVSLLAASDARFTAVVIDRRTKNPFGRREAWKVHAQLAINAVNRSISGDEVASVILDHLSLPEGVNYESYVRTAVNRQKSRLAVVSVTTMDSRACWGIQMADLLTGAVAHHYRQQTDPSAKSASPKGQMADFISEQFNLNTLVGADSARFRVAEQGPKKEKLARLVPVKGRANPSIKAG